MGDSVELVRSPRLAAVEYAYAATVSATARIIHTAGACPLDAEGAVVGVTVLGYPGLLVEIEAFAAVAARDA